jgi:hypothetical protein
MPEKKVVTIHICGTTMGRVEGAPEMDGKLKNVTIYNDGDLWMFNAAGKMGLYARDPDSNHVNLSEGV